jgi:magnesium transporter
MKKINKKYSFKQNLPPGSLVHTGNKYQKNTKIHICIYNADEIEDYELENIEDILPLIKPDRVNWIKISGLQDISIFEKINKLFKAHTLMLEDILNTHHLPKVEDYNEHIFLTIKQLKYKADIEYIEKHQISFILGSNYLFTFEELESDLLEPIILRLKNKKGKVRWMGNDYLMYAITDICVDAYLRIIDEMEDDIEKIEEELLNNHSKLIVEKIMLKRKQHLSLKKTIYPMLDEMRKLKSIDSELICNKTLIYFQDIIDHLNLITQNIEAFRETISNMMDMYLANNDIKMNDIMKRLTVVATIFIPLTFIVGLYGMNFKYMPELEWKYGYLYIWIVMLITVVGMLIYLKRQKWL